MSEPYYGYAVSDIHAGAELLIGKDASGRPILLDECGLPATEHRPPPAPPKPVSAEERAGKVISGRVEAARWIAVRDDIAIAIREAESAAWDRAVESARQIAHSRRDPKTTSEIASLKGKCHEAKP